MKKIDITKHTLLSFQVDFNQKMWNSLQHSSFKVQGAMLALQINAVGGKLFSLFKAFFCPPPPREGGGYFRNFRVGMCRWDP